MPNYIADVTARMARYNVTSTGLPHQILIKTMNNADDYLWCCQCLGDLPANKHVWFYVQHDNGCITYLFRDLTTAAEFKLRFG